MSKYTAEQLKEMADTFFEAEAAHDMRCLQLTLAVAMKTGLHPEEVRARIRGYLGVETQA